ncbi:MAG: hypothetical protein AABW79_04350 [Nanoarchaeota archaeon]
MGRRNYVPDSDWLDENQITYFGDMGERGMKYVRNGKQVLIYGTIRSEEGFDVYYRDLRDVSVKTGGKEGTEEVSGDDSSKPSEIIQRALEKLLIL